MRSRINLAVVLAIVVAGSASAARAQQTDWRELALRAQQNATTDQMIAAGIIAGLQAEVLELKAHAKASPPPPQPDANK